MTKKDWKYVITINNPESYDCSWGENDSDYDSDVVKRFYYGSFESMLRGWHIHLDEYEGYYYSVRDSSGDVFVSGAYDPGDDEWIVDHFKDKVYNDHRKRNRKKRRSS